jgi:transcriptional regulator with XRE-family HTH domain
MEPKEQKIKNTHHGHAIKRFRHTLGIKQEALATEMGLSQALISTYEQRKVLNDDVIERFAKALNVAPELIKELEEDPVTFIVENNTFENGSVNNIASSSDISNENCGNTYNPIEQILELSKEKTILYERMLELEKEKSALLEQMIKEKK